MTNGSYRGSGGLKSATQKVGTIHPANEEVSPEVDRFRCIDERLS